LYRITQEERADLTKLPWHSLSFTGSQTLPRTSPRLGTHDGACSGPSVGLYGHRPGWTLS
jgi:hypothetical protein